MTKNTHRIICPTSSNVNLSMKFKMVLHAYGTVTSRSMTPQMIAPIRGEMQQQGFNMMTDSTQSDFFVSLVGLEDVFKLLLVEDLKMFGTLL